MQAICYDIIIVGAGMIGSSLALALSNLPLRVALIEATAASIDRPPVDSRPLALNYASTTILQKLGIWQAIVSYANSIVDVQVSVQGRFAKLTMTANESGVPALGYVIPAGYLGLVLRQNLLQRLSETPYLTLYQPARPHSVNKNATGWAVRLICNTQHLTLQSPLLIAADGTQSCVRRLLNIAATIHDYNETAIVTTVYSTTHHCHVAYERFTEQGIVALLPGPQHQMGLVWTLPTQASHGLLQCPEERFLERLQTVFGYRLGRFFQLGPRSFYPLIRSYTDQPQQAGLVFMGNAAHTLHPIAAQGLNLSLQGLATLITVLTTTLHNQPILTPDCLQHYFHSCVPRQRHMLILTDYIKTLFCYTQGPLALASQGGLLVLDLLPLIKRRFIQNLVGSRNQWIHKFQLLS